MKLNRPLVFVGSLSALYLLALSIRLVQWPPEVGHLATTIVAVLIVHVLDHTYFRGEVKQEFEAMSSHIVADVKRQVGQELEVLKKSVRDGIDESRKALEHSLNALLADQSESIAAMQRNSIRRLYSTRSAAAPRIAEGLAEGSKVVRLMGVSLNDFFRGDNAHLRDGWIKISEAIRDSEKGEAAQEIRVLMANPRSFGATLRSFAESAETGPTFVGRLKNDVEAALDNLMRLEEISADRKIRLSCRLYNVAPNMFICHVDKHSFVQHYHFWTQRRDATPMAVIEYEEHRGSKDVFPMHNEIKAHFDVIWDNAAIPISDYWTQVWTGIDEAAGQSGLVNMYNDAHEGGSRIGSLMTAWQQQKRPFAGSDQPRGISIQGISLKSFFSNGNLSDGMYQIIRAGKTDVRVLFLDPEGEQARFRAYREYLMEPQGHNIDYSVFTDALLSERSLAKNTRSAIEQLRNWIAEFSEDPNWTCRVKARKYRSAPQSFTVQIGDRLLVEPYNYGKLGGRSSAPTTLGTDMPLFEFQAEIPKMFNDIEYQKKHLELRNPFQLVMDHFNFAFRTGTEIPLKREDRRHSKGQGA